MTNLEIIEKLRIEFIEIEKLGGVSEYQFFHKKNNKDWSIYENIEHLILATNPLVMLFEKPEIMLVNWGRSNRASRKYSSVSELYLKHIGIPGSTTKDYSPIRKEISKAEIFEKFQFINNNLLEIIASLSENDLDNYQIPHPRIGLLTCREILYFTHYHTVHHLKTIKGILKSPQIREV